MRIGDICIRHIISANSDMPVLEAAQIMRSRHVGTVVVVENGKHGTLPIGIVTDRDIVLGIIAPNIDTALLTVGDIMSRDLVTVPQDQDVFETIAQMHRHGIRRLPVIDTSGVLVGIVSSDDLMELLAMQLSELSRITTRERQHEVELRP